MAILDRSGDIKNRPFFPYGERSFGICAALYETLTGKNPLSMHFACSY